MKTTKNLIRTAVLTLILATLTSCASKPSETNTNKPDNTQTISTPVGKNVALKSNVILINGKPNEIANTNIGSATAVTHSVTYRLEHAKDTLTIVLPKSSPTTSWSLQETDNVQLISYALTRLKDTAKEPKDGEIPETQTFEIRINPDKVSAISFKLSNVNEVGKGYADKKAYYELSIKLQP